MSVCEIEVACRTGGPTPETAPLFGIHAWVRDDPRQRFTAAVLPLEGGNTDRRALLKAFPRDPSATALERLQRIGMPEADALADFASWTRSVAAGRRPLLVSRRLAVDWHFLNVGFHRALGGNPFGIGGFDLHSWDVGRRDRHPGRVGRYEVMVDVEAGGPAAGLYPMLSVGACLVDDPSTTFYAEVRPESEREPNPPAVQVGWPHASATATLERLAQDGLPPAFAMHRLSAWVRQHGRGRRPLFVAHNAAFDWQFVAGAASRDGVRLPFRSDSVVDMPSYWAGHSGGTYLDGRWGKLPKAVTRGLVSDHHAGRDAQLQAVALQRMRGSMLDAPALRQPSETVIAI